ncbi:hypothetical protein B0H14DRAFT_3505801 [Mycena olivaceomarginata]|nr:hypothetical protein B0H14DRAFT_3505801 [Mycena olivaceomarginata]
MLHKAGCTQGKVGSVISNIAKHAGLEVKGDMSRCTVQCALIEGGVAACVQLGYEMADTDGQRSALNFEVHNFLCVWKGGNGDHAPDVKNFYQLGEGWKRKLSRILLGYDELQRMEPQKLVDLVRDILQSNLRQVGGEAEWAKLSNNEKNARKKSLMDTLAFRLGEEVSETLPEETKHAFDDGMKKFYEEHPELDQPVLLANKDNDQQQGGSSSNQKLAEDTGGESTAAVWCALKVSEHNGVKFISLFGALVSHKDDKKGLHDIYENYFRPTIGAGFRFPDVSNTRYQSHGHGGDCIITYLKEHRDFMDFIKDNKQKRMLNHLEQNIIKGIHCPQMISQMVALVLFCMAVMHLYALHIRGPGTENLNMLDLSPYHSSMKEHMKKLIADPTPFFSPSTDSYKIATLDGQPWSDTKSWAACIELFSTLPHVQPLMLAGLKSALECFKQFTTEFVEGGLIDTSTEAKRLKGNMPAHNDNNEGLLGGWHKFSHESPSSTVAHFTDQAMFKQNKTRAFIDDHMNTEEDQQFLRQEVRQIDQSGLEKAWREELNAYKLAAVDAKRAKDA